MTSADTQRNFARRAALMTGLIIAVVIVFFTVRGEATQGIIAAVLLAGWGYFEYRRRKSDADMIDDEPEEDPFERRERSYNRKR